MMALLNEVTYKTVRDKLVDNGIHMDLGDFAIFRKLIDYFNGGSDEDFIIGDEFLEYYNLGINDFEEIGHYEDGDVAYLHKYNFDKFCENLCRYYGRSLDELFLEYYDEVLE